MAELAFIGHAYRLNPRRVTIMSRTVGEAVTNAVCPELWNFVLVEATRCSS
jgi:hypothetical protein